MMNLQVNTVSSGVKLIHGFSGYSKKHPGLTEVHNIRDFNEIPSAELIKLIKSTNSEWSQSPPEQYSDKVIGEPVHSSGTSAIRKTSLKTVTFKKLL